MLSHVKNKITMLSLLCLSYSKKKKTFLTFAQKSAMYEILNDHLALKSGLSLAKNIPNRPKAGKIAEMQHMKEIPKD